MEEFDLGIRIRGSRRSRGNYPAEILLPDHRRLGIRLPADLRNLPVVSSGLPLNAQSYELARTVEAALGRDMLAQMAEGRAPNVSLRLSLQIDPPELAALPWDGLQLSGLPHLTIVRYQERAVERLRAPMSFPVDLLVTGPVKSEALQYFRVVRAEGPALAPRVQELVRGAPFDILHLGWDALWPSEDAGQQLWSGDQLVRAWVRALQRCRARLMVIDAAGEAAPRALEYAQRLLNAGAPPIMVLTYSDQSDSATDALYFDIVHSWSLPIILEQPVVRCAAALFLPRAGAGALDQRTAAAALVGRARALRDRRHDLRLAQAMQTVPFGVGAVPDPSARLTEVVERTYLFEHETGGMQPLTEGAELVHDAAKRLADDHARLQRTVNISFLDCASKRILPHREPLLLGGSYSLSVQIGAPSPASLVQAPQPLDTGALRHRDGRLELRVVVFSTDVVLEVSEAIVVLPPAPEESDSVWFPFRAPQKTGTARLRVAVYHERDLLQTLLVEAVVAESGALRRASALTVRVDFTLTDDFVGVTADLRAPEPNRALSIIMNQAPSGTHSFFVDGAGPPRQFDLGETEIIEKAELARDLLRELAGADDRRYRFDDQNRGEIGQLTQHVTRLAGFGNTLFVDLVAGKNRDFADRLRSTLDEPGRVIQVAMTRSAKHVFPWALVYDRKLMRGAPNLRLCDQFEAALRAGGAPGSLIQSPCFAGRCSHHDDPMIVCPSGFWGFRHLVEQPLPLPDPEPGIPPEPPREHITTSSPVPLAMGVSLDLVEQEAHGREIDAIAGFQVDRRETLDAIGAALRGHEAAIHYLYCHGGRLRSDVWLGVGRSERLFLTYFDTWEVRWADLHPLVFVNGCHTAEVKPDDLLSILRILVWSGASGVIGTEIPVPEVLARAVGSGLLARIVNHDQLGQAMRTQRLALLERGNVLGLAYTPYGFAKLKLITT